jgi:hypothetical protein
MGRFSFRRRARGRDLASPAYALCLGLLLLNDLVLKALLHNWFTGKLSDFAGLFVFPAFWSALLPRHKRRVYFLTALGFMFWKSPWSQPVIDGWNGLGLLQIGRTVDATDLLALLVLPLSAWYFDREVPIRKSGLGPYLVALVSLFAFGATQAAAPRFESNETYYFEDSKTSLIRKLHHLSHLDPVYSLQDCSSSSGDDKFYISFRSEVCGVYERATATIHVGEEVDRSLITLTEVRHHCPRDASPKAALVDGFQREVVDQLKAMRLEAPHNDLGVGRPEARLKGNGELYLVPIGILPDVSCPRLAAYFAEHYYLKITTLPGLPLTGGRQYGSGTNDLRDFMINSYSALAERPSTILIGIAEDMYSGPDRRLNNFVFQGQTRFPLVGVRNLDAATYCEPQDNELLEARLLKILARTIGTLYYHMHQSDDPESVFYESVGCVDELDYERRLF